MFNEKSISRKDFLKCLLGAMFSFVCIVKMPNLGLSNKIAYGDDANHIYY